MLMIQIQNQARVDVTHHVQGSHSDWKNWKTWENGKAFSSQGKVREFWTDWKSQGKVRENHTNTGKLRAFQKKLFVFFSMIFKWTVYYLLKCIKFLVRKNETLKKYWKMEKNTGKVREFCQPGKVGTLMYVILSRSYLGGSLPCYVTI